LVIWPQWQLASCSFFKALRLSRAAIIAGALHCGLDFMR
jgi:hypothetical protein